MFGQFLLRRRIREYQDSKRFCLEQASLDQDPVAARAWLSIADNYREAIEHLERHGRLDLPEQFTKVPQGETN